MTDRPYSVATLAERWGCSRRHIYNLIERGELHIFRAGGTLRRISAAEVARWESAGDPTRSEVTDLDILTDRPSPPGATKTARTDLDLAERQAKARREASSIRSHIRRQKQSQPTADRQ